MIDRRLGNKKDNITIVYTPWSNLKKDGSMAVGQVGFKDQRKVSLVNLFVADAQCIRCCVFLCLYLSNDIKVKRIHVQQRENPIVNRLNKTKVEKYPDLAMEKENRLKELRKRDRDAQQARVSLLDLGLILFVLIFSNILLLVLLTFLH